MKWVCLKPDDHLIRKVVVGLMVSSMVIMLPLSLQPSYESFLLPDASNFNVILKNLFEFWS